MDRNLQTSGFLQILVSESIIAESLAVEAMNARKTQKSAAIEFLIHEKQCNARELALIGSQHFGVPFLDLNAFDPNLIPLKLLNEKLIKKHHALPLYVHANFLTVAVSDPSNQITLDELKFQTGYKIITVIVEANKLTRLIDEILSQKENAVFESVFEDQSLDGLTEEKTNELEDSAEIDLNFDAPIVRFVNKILLDAIKQGASDIHFEPYEKYFRVRFRIDGILHEASTPPMNLAMRIISRIKILSQLDISERRLPQDGRFMMNLSKNNTIDFRVSTCPTVNGEKVVMRILDPNSANIGIDKLGFNARQEASFLDVIKQPQGMVLVTGPTGSGKTVTLYTALNLLNKVETNISTAEDPVEIKVSGFNQVNINLKTGLTFSSALRAFLRQDPDIIMVGEIRDLETAEIALKAAQTGHFVLSTLHTNSAAETLTRLMNMGVEPYNIVGSVSLIIAQRLARKLCVHCKKPATISFEVLEQAGFHLEPGQERKLFQAEGCEHCTLGYKGRLGLYELLKIDDKIADSILHGGSAMDIKQIAKENGFISLKESGFEKMLEGSCSFEEIIRVIKD